MKFTNLPLSSELIQVLDENNFTEQTQVQELAIPKIFEGKSLMVQAQTGTGKTAAFLIPFIERLLAAQKEDQNAQGNRDERKVLQGLIIAPTRELAAQIMEDAEILGAEDFNIEGAVLSGGINIEKQQRALKRAQFVVATPGRLLDFCGRNKSMLSNISYFVIDEADSLFDMGFFPDLKKILGFLPPAEKRQSLLFSATLPQKIRQLANQFFHKSVEIDVPATSLAVDKIKQELVYVLQKEKISLTLGYLKQMTPEQTALIFTNTKHIAESLALRLMYNGINCNYINGDLPQAKRQKIIQRMKEKKLSVLIATDVVARGIHIHDLDLVINYDIPADPQNYIHRIGRTGRAGKNGEALAYVCDKYAYYLRPIEKLLGHKINQIKEDYHDIMTDDLSEGVKLSELARSAHKTLASSHDREDSPQRSQQRSNNGGGNRRYGGGGNGGGNRSSGGNGGNRGGSKNYRSSSNRNRQERSERRPDRRSERSDDN